MHIWLFQSHRTRKSIVAHSYVILFLFALFLGCSVLEPLMACQDQGRASTQTPPYPAFGLSELRFGQGLEVRQSFSWCGFWLVYAHDPQNLQPRSADNGGSPPGAPTSKSELHPQIAVMKNGRILIVSVPAGKSVCWVLKTHGEVPRGQLLLKVSHFWGGAARLQAHFAGTQKDVNKRDILLPGHDDKPKEFVVETKGVGSAGPLLIILFAPEEAAAIRLENPRWIFDNGTSVDLELVPPASPEVFPPPILPPYHPAIEMALLEWDWRLQDGIGTQREPVGFSEAVSRLLDRVQAFLSDWQTGGNLISSWQQEFEELCRQYASFSSEGQGTTERDWEKLWKKVHLFRRRLMLNNPQVSLGPVAFVKQAPSAFSHQLTQYYGRDARPGGGIFVLEAPGQSMKSRSLTESKLPEGSYQHLDLDYDATRLVFAFCGVDRPPPNRDAHPHCFYHLYEVRLDGSELRPLTDGPYDDFAPRYLPDGSLIFISTRRGGFHRCGRGPCPVYTLTRREVDGTIRVISFHETHEWDPAVLPDGRVIYTRWDYVDRHAVHYQHLWTARPDGSDVRIFYGNGTLNPVGIWEAVPVPGSRKVMATAAAHHAMTAGSIVLVDITRGIDDLAPLERLTPEVPFAESETPVIRDAGGVWHAPVGVRKRPPIGVDARRWPGHCYRSPYPFNEKCFLAAYSYDALIGEPTANRANMFGLYLVDRFGNREPLYRDLNISSLWPVVIRPRPRPPEVPAVFRDSEQAEQLSSTQTAFERRESTAPQLPQASGLSGAMWLARYAAPQIPKEGGDFPSTLGEKPRAEGVFFLRNVYNSWPLLPTVKINKLRIVQILPKATPHINSPPVGLANASPGKQVLGTVPVEEDGSACFVAPARIPLAFQALDERGQAVQIMRSVTYLQPGEFCGCVGCHEPRNMAPQGGNSLPLALQRPPSLIQPGPPGSKPFSYPRLVQPILDRHCVICHDDRKTEGSINLVGRPEGHYTVSYLALAPRVKFSVWDGRGDFVQTNCEPYTHPDFFGARGSPVMNLITQGHGGVILSPDEFEALATWIDCNALFYGTFDPDDQRRQQRGEEIRGPSIE